MPTKFSQAVFGLSITSVIGLYCLALAPSALAKNDGGNNNKNQTSTTTNTSSNTTSSTSTGSSLACNVTDVLIGKTNATACKGPFDGNDTGAGNPLLTQLNNGLFDLGSNANWSLAGKSDSNENNLFGFKAQNGSDAGSWGLGKALGSGPSTFVISLKSSTKYSAYLFKDIDFTKTGLDGFFNTIGVALAGNGKEGKGKELSHASLFVASYVKPPQPPKVRVPEPSASIGLGLVVGGMVIARRRESKNVQK
ncbi:MAG: PEP-CTERM sorting domain-containing protein [Tolypothrix brevis GSE-NOS-MK-07-07A]|nr:PEP-CTERM sorting domain-containing protein [Tolypothrix brevis GSE-NOS-MK-07-07A]